MDFVSKHRVTGRSYAISRIEQVMRTLNITNPFNLNNPTIRYKLFEYHTPTPNIDTLPIENTLSQVFLGVDLSGSNR